MSNRLVALVLTVLVGVAGAGVAGPATSDAEAKARAKASFRISSSAPFIGQKIRLRANGKKCSGCRYRWAQRTGSKKPYRKLGRGRSIRVKFAAIGYRRIRLTVHDGRRKFRKSRRIRVRTAAGQIGKPSCVTGASSATSAGQVRDLVAAGNNVCVTAAVGNVDLDDLQSATMRHVGTSGSGSMDTIHLDGASSITFRARFESTVITFSNNITIERSIIGGTPADRTFEQLIFIPDRSDDVTIRDNDIGWTSSDDSGNTGYGIRAYNESARLRIERNYIHHIGGDGIQLGMSGPDTLVDRNEIAYVAKSPGSNEHADDLQVTGNGPNMRITNNYLHHNGWLTSNGPVTGGSGPYIHAGGSDSLIFENNLVRDEGNFMQVGNLGTGGCNRSNLTFRRNTFLRNGTLFDGAADLHWRLCGGSGNRYERNVVNDTFWNEYGFGASGTVARDNLDGSQYTIDSNGKCTVAACNPSGDEPIGFRKPAGVHW